MAHRARPERLPQGGPPRRVLRPPYHRGASESQFFYSVRPFVMDTLGAELEKLHGHHHLFEAASNVSDQRLVLNGFLA